MPCSTPMPDPPEPSSDPTATVRASCPGRVTLIGDHTDYNEGIALSIAVDRHTDVILVPDPGSSSLTVRSDAFDQDAVIDLHVGLDAALRSRQPAWSRYIAAVVGVVRPPSGGTVTITTSLPVGAGLSSSAALTVASALAFGLRGDPLTVARTCQRAEQAATGIDVGLFDPWAVAAATAGNATLLDFRTLSLSQVELPEDADVVVVHSGEQRSLDRSGYQARQAECDAAAFRLGPLGHIEPEAVLGLPDPVLRRRARHVVTECDRVRWFVEALGRHDLTEAGRLMYASHRSLSEDFDVSTPRLDELVHRLSAIPGVYGARLTGAGFGGCVVALTAPGALDPTLLAEAAWRVTPSNGAHLLRAGS